jgi:hypothetical protein
MRRGTGKLPAKRVKQLAISKWQNKSRRMGGIFGRSGRLLRD